MVSSAHLQAVSCLVFSVALSFGVGAVSRSFVDMAKVLHFWVEHALKNYAKTLDNLLVDKPDP